LSLVAFFLGSAAFSTGNSFLGRVSVLFFFNQVDLLSTSWTPPSKRELADELNSY
jgi:hypothetical protein